MALTQVLSRELFDIGLDDLISREVAWASRSKLGLAAPQAQPRTWPALLAGILHGMVVGLYCKMNSLSGVLLSTSTQSWPGALLGPELWMRLTTG